MHKHETKTTKNQHPNSSFEIILISHAQESPDVSIFFSSPYIFIIRSTLYPHILHAMSLPSIDIQWDNRRSRINDNIPRCMNNAHLFTNHTWNLDHHIGNSNESQQVVGFEWVFILTFPIPPIKTN